MRDRPLLGTGLLVASRRCARVVLAACAIAPAVARDVVDRDLPGGGRMIALRDADSEAVHVRIGFPCAALPADGARYAAALRDALTTSLARQLTSAGATLAVEFDGDTVVVALRASLGAYAELVQLTSRALAAPPWSPSAPSLAGPALGHTYVDLAGAVTPFGPDASGGPNAAAASSALDLLLAADGEHAAPPASPRVPGSEGPSAALDLAALHAELMRRDALVLAVLGDLDIEAAYTLGDDAAAAFPALPRGPTRTASPLAVPLTREVWIRSTAGATAEASVEANAAGFALLGAGSRADAPDAAALLVLEEHLSARLMPGGLADSTAGVAFAPGWGRAGRVALWYGSPEAQLVAGSEALLALLAESARPTAEELGTAKARAVARLASDSSALETLVRSHRLALRGAVAGWRARLTREVEALTPDAIAETAHRHLAVEQLLCAAVIRPELVEGLASLGTLVEVAGRADGPHARVDSPGIDQDREAAQRALTTLFDACGGRAVWASAQAAELRGRLTTRAGESFELSEVLDLAQARFSIQVTQGGTTVLDLERAHWRGAGDRRTLDPAPLQRDARLGLFSVLHRLALEGRFDVRVTAEGLLLEEAGQALCVLALDAQGRPARLTASAEPTRRWSFEDWRSVGGVLAPATVVDETIGARLALTSVRLLDRFDVAVLR